ncbi:hypothetical protein [Caulobacter sp. B11]|uniref:hypothetical protein n=1 Tax=Caulobacter sp. B11 TaxID=2048899 RepID=UPI00117E9FDB|nr:hypothetical protein [Caulobacter sp. B11]
MHTLDTAQWTMRPATAGQVILACIGVPFVALGLVGAWASFTSGDLLWAVIIGIALPSGGCWLLTEISTVRLHLTEERLWLTRRGFVCWSVERDQAVLEPGGVGDLSTLPGLIVIERKSGKKVGEIISGQFRADELAKLRAALSIPAA